MFLIESGTTCSKEPMFFNFAQINAFSVEYCYRSDNFVEGYGYIHFNRSDGNSITIMFRNKDKLDNILDKVYRELSFVKFYFNNDNVSLNGKENLNVFINMDKILIISAFKINSGQNYININFDFVNGERLMYIIKNKEFAEKIFKIIRKKRIKIDVVKKKKSRLEVLGVS